MIRIYFMDPEKRAGMANAIGQELMQIVEFNKSEENRGGDNKSEDLPALLRALQVIW
jgi:hypothetical protein